MACPSLTTVPRVHVFWSFETWACFSSSLFRLSGLFLNPCVFSCVYSTVFVYDVLQSFWNACGSCCRKRCHVTSARKCWWWWSRCWRTMPLRWDGQSVPLITHGVIQWSTCEICFNFTNWEVQKSWWHKKRISGGDPQLLGEGMPADPWQGFDCWVQGVGGQLLPHHHWDHHRRTGE